VEDTIYKHDDYISDIIYRLTSLQERDWIEQAACRGMDTNLFFPERGDIAAVNKAVEICNSCPVKKECREYGDMETVGIWGGASTKRRKVERRQSAV
jgi:WhiB family redox-sensing transcriptional regulator